MLKQGTAGNPESPTAKHAPVPKRTRWNQRIVQQWPLILAALFAVVWAIVRARVQSITMDEAQTYLFFVARSDLWFPFPNNHVLNSLLMWVTTHAFGNSILAIRGPALLGGAIYIFICYYLCRTITNRLILQLPLFVCLVYNPFIFDFMVAARGYSLADAFLLAAIAVPVWYQASVRRPSLTGCCALASLALGLSFTANFSFAFVDLAAFLVIAAWAIRRREVKPVWRIVGWCVLPGLLAVLLLCGYPLAHWPKRELWWGAHSLTETMRSLIEASLYRLDPRFLGFTLYHLIDSIGKWLPPILGVLCFCQLVLTRLDARAGWMGKLVIALAGITALSMLMSWLAFRFANLPLPLGRTGIFLVPLCTLIAGIIAAAPALSRVTQWLSRGITALLICLSCYFLLCLRLTYFKEYEWDRDLKDVYSVLARLNHIYGVSDVAMNGLYLTSLNYYRLSSKRETFDDFTSPLPGEPARKSIYVLDGQYERGFLDKEKLTVIYRGKSSDVVIAVRPGVRIPPITTAP